MASCPNEASTCLPHQSESLQTCALRDLAVGQHHDENSEWLDWNHIANPPLPLLWSNPSGSLEDTISPNFNAAALEEEYSPSLSYDNLYKPVEGKEYQNQILAGQPQNFLSTPGSNSRWSLPPYPEPSLSSREGNTSADSYSISPEQNCHFFPSTLISGTALPRPTLTWNPNVSQDAHGLFFPEDLELAPEELESSREASLALLNSDFGVSPSQPSPTSQSLPDPPASVSSSSPSARTSFLHPHQASSTVCDAPFLQLPTPKANTDISTTSSPALQPHPRRTSKPPRVIKKYHFIPNHDKHSAAQIRNTLASRKYRESKIGRITDLERQLQRNEAEKEMWRQRALRLGWKQ